MNDGIIKATGNSRFIRANLPESYDEFRAMAAAGTLPADVLFNAAGWNQLPTFLNKGNLLSDATAALLGGCNTPNEAFGVLSKAALYKALTLPDKQIFVDWNNTVVPTGYSRIAYGDKFVTASPNQVTMYSEDGANWIKNPQVLSSSANYFLTRYAGEKYFALARESSFYSDDGISWASLPGETTITQSYTKTPNDVTYFKGKYYIPTSGNRVFASTDAISWSSVFNFSYVIKNLKANSIAMVAVDVNGAVYSTTDGVTFTQRLTGIDTRLEVANEVFVVKTTDNTSFYTSVDGINWILHSLPVSNSSYGPVYADGKYGFYIGSNIYTTTDFTNWEGPYANLTSFSDIVSNGVDTVVFDSAGTFYYSKNTLAYQQSITDIAGTKLLDVPGLQIAVGSYTGNGTYGANNPCRLTFPFVPKLLFIGTKTSAGIGNSPVFMMADVNSYTVQLYGNQPGSGSCSFNGNSASWYASDNQKQLNYQGQVYAFISLG